MISLHFEGKVKEIACQNNQRLDTLLRSNEVSFFAYCGGKGTCGKCKVRFLSPAPPATETEIKLLTALETEGGVRLACCHFAKDNTELLIESVGEVSSDSGVKHVQGNVQGKNAYVALDIGTTTLALALCDETGGVVKVLTAVNPQTAFGADVISRIAYCAQNGVGALNKVIISKVNDMLGELQREYQFASIEKMTVSGNMTMLHIFFGVSCASMGVSPYEAAFLASRTATGAQLGLAYDTTVISFAGFHAFAGGDLAAGVYYVQMPVDGYDILIDLGTNAEIALFSKDKLLCTAAAAGPCFEGANISQGMSAIDGAIYRYRYPHYAATIGGGAPKGVCGTGLIDAVAQLLIHGIIDENGTFVTGDSLQLADGVKLTQGDVRQYQLAKSAVRSALDTLLNEQGLTMDRINKVYLGGGFSGLLNVDNCIVTGLLPAGVAGKCVPIANSSLKGAIKRLFSDETEQNLVDVAVFSDLMGSVLFKERFEENIGF